MPTRERLPDTQLEGRDYLMGASFTVPDAYLFVVAGWGKYVGVV